MSYMVIEAVHAADYLATLGISCEVIDLRTISPLDWTSVFASVRQTGYLLALDTGHATGSVAGEIIARVAMECWAELKGPPQRLAMPDFPEGTSQALTEKYHPRAENIAMIISSMMGVTLKKLDVLAKRDFPHDVPGDWFRGPF